jgi:site-specific DNA recombinase
MREIIQGADEGKTYARPMPANARAVLIQALRDAHRWTDELLSDSRLTLESLASRASRTVRSIRMILSLAFLAPEIVKATVRLDAPPSLLKQRAAAVPPQGRYAGRETLEAKAACMSRCSRQ